jgi:hypothetical protein
MTEENARLKRRNNHLEKDQEAAEIHVKAKLAEIEELEIQAKYLTNKAQA